MDNEKDVQALYNKFEDNVCRFGLHLHHQQENNMEKYTKLVFVKQIDGGEGYLSYTPCHSVWDLRGAVSYLTNPDFEFLNLYTEEGNIVLFNKANVALLSPILCDAPVENLRVDG